MKHRILLSTLLLVTTGLVAMDEETLTMDSISEEGTHDNSNNGISRNLLSTLQAYQFTSFAGKSMVSLYNQYANNEMEEKEFIRNVKNLLSTGMTKEEKEFIEKKFGIKADPPKTKEKKEKKNSSKERERNDESAEDNFSDEFEEASLDGWGEQNDQSYGDPYTSNFKGYQNDPFTAHNFESEIWGSFHQSYKDLSQGIIDKAEFVKKIKKQLPQMNEDEKKAALDIVAEEIRKVLRQRSNLATKKRLAEKEIKKRKEALEMAKNEEKNHERADNRELDFLKELGALARELPLEKAGNDIQKLIKDLPEHESGIFYTYFWWLKPTNCVLQ